MSKIMSIHILEAVPGANPEEFAKVLLEVASAGYVINVEGWRSYIVKGDRGVGKGQFALIHEFDSINARNRYFATEDGEPAPETQRIFSSLEQTELVKRWDELTKEVSYTDYVSVGR